MNSKSSSPAPHSSSPAQGSPKIYTKTGDKGKTSLIGGTRVSKADPRLDAYGTVDELNSFIGLLIRECENDLGPATDIATKTTLTRIQHALFKIGSQLACEDPALLARLPAIDGEDVAGLESEMDLLSQELKPLRNFVLPGGCRSAATAHVARTVCRRAERFCVALQEPSAGNSSENPPGMSPSGQRNERIVVQYLNRLSDYLFVLARFLNWQKGVDEPLWEAKACQTASSETSKPSSPEGLTAGAARARDE